MDATKAAGAAATSANDARMFDQLAGQIDVHATSLSELLQTHHVARRTGLAPDRARLIASLHFPEAPQ